jgi:hypothetical protein
MDSDGNGHTQPPGDGNHGHAGESEAKGKPPSRDARGRLLPGHQLPGPGRPRASFDLMSVCRRAAKREGIDIKEKLWQAFRTALDMAIAGDLDAAKLVFDRACGQVERIPPQLALQLNQQINSVVANGGPAIPDDANLGKWVKRLGAAAKRQGIVSDDDTDDGDDDA